MHETMIKKVVATIRSAKQEASKIHFCYNKSQMQTSFSKISNNDQQKPNDGLVSSRHLSLPRRAK